VLPSTCIAAGLGLAAWPGLTPSRARPGAPIRDPAGLHLRRPVALLADRACGDVDRARRGRRSSGRAVRLRPIRPVGSRRRLPRRRRWHLLCQHRNLRHPIVLPEEACDS
jgi:hypothetical protein